MGVYEGADIYQASMPYLHECASANPINTSSFVKPQRLEMQTPLSGLIR